MPPHQTHSQLRRLFPQKRTHWQATADSTRPTHNHARPKHNHADTPARPTRPATRPTSGLSPHPSPQPAAVAARNSLQRSRCCAEYGTAVASSGSSWLPLLWRVRHRVSQASDRRASPDNDRPPAGRQGAGLRPKERPSAVRVAKTAGSSTGVLWKCCRPFLLAARRSAARVGLPLPPRIREYAGGEGPCPECSPPLPTSSTITHPGGQPNRVLAGGKAGGAAAVGTYRTSPLKPTKARSAAAVHALRLHSPNGRNNRSVEHNRWCKAPGSPTREHKIQCTT